MPFAAITYDIKAGHEDEVAEVFGDFRRPTSSVVPGAWFMATQPGVQEVERKLAPFLGTPRNTGTPEGFVQTFKSSLLRSVSQLAGPRTS
jgi:SchA/CurD like domain